MSLNSARKLGAAASIITVITPVITLLLGFFIVLSVIATLQSWINANSSTLPVFSGEILMVFAIPAILSLVGFVLFVISMYKLSHYYNAPGIFTYIVYAIIEGIIGVIVVYALFSLYFLPLVANATLNTLAIPFITQFITDSLGIVVVIFVFALFSGVFYYRAFAKLSENSGSGSFKSAGMLYLIGSLTSIFLIGFLFIWIGWILAAKGFYSLKPKPAKDYSRVSTETPPITPPITPQTIRCPFCGKENPVDGVYCRSCGNKLQP
jgi:uncharacterized membrane protein